MRGGCGGRIYILSAREGYRVGWENVYTVSDHEGGGRVGESGKYECSKKNRELFETNR